jgi:hypothetical protein
VNYLPSITCNHGANHYFIISSIFTPAQLSRVYGNLDDLKMATSLPKHHCY